MTLELHGGHNPVDRRRVLLRLLHTRKDLVHVGAQVGDGLGTDKDHVGRAMLHHRLDQLSVFLANIVDIRLKFLLRFRAEHGDASFLAKQIRPPFFSIHARVVRDGVGMIDVCKPTALAQQECFAE